MNHKLIDLSLLERFKQLLNKKLAALNMKVDEKLIEVDEKFREVNANLPHIESGTIEVQFSNVQKLYEIEFKSAFKEPPVIQLTVASGQISSHARAILKDGSLGVTTTKFQFNTYYSETSVRTGTVHWLAIDKL